MSKLEAPMEPNGGNPVIVANDASSPKERDFLVDLTMEDTSDEADNDEASENESIASTRSSNEDYDDWQHEPEEWDARDTTGDADFREDKDDTSERDWTPEPWEEEGMEEPVEDIVAEIETPTINGLTFLRIVSQISQEINGDMSWDIDAIHALQEAAEDWLGIVLANALDIAVHAGRDFIEPGDIKLVLHLRRFDRHCAVDSARYGFSVEASEEELEGVQPAATKSSDKVERVATGKAN